METQDWKQKLKGFTHIKIPTVYIYLKSLLVQNSYFLKVILYFILAF